MWQVGVRIHVSVAAVSDEKISTGAKNRTAVFVIANTVRFLDNVKFGDLEVWLRRRESEKESSFRLNVAAFAISFCESDVGETTADFTSISLCKKLIY